MSINMEHITRKINEQIDDIYYDVKNLFMKQIERGGGIVRGFDIDCIVTSHNLGMLPKDNGILVRLVNDFPEWEIISEKSPWLPCVDYKVIRKRHDEKESQKKGERKLSDFGGAYASPKYRYSREKSCKYESFLVSFDDDGRIELTPVSSN